MRGNEFKILENDIAIKTTQSKDPLKLIEDYKNDFTVKNAENLPRFCGGLVGYFSFDTVRFTEKKLGFKNHKDSLETPVKPFQPNPPIRPDVPPHVRPILKPENPFLSAFFSLNLTL